MIFDATRKYGNRGLAVGRKSERDWHDIHSKADIDLWISVKFGPLGSIGLDYTSVVFFEVEKDLIDHNDELKYI